MSLLQNSNAISSGGNDIYNSLRFRKSAFAYLNRTPATTTNQKTFTFSAWIKKTDLGYLHAENRDIFGTRVDGDNGFRFYFTTSDTIDVFSQVAGAIGARLTTTQVFRDPSAWYHIILVIDTTNATAGNRMRLYVNGSEITAFTTDTQPSLNYSTYINTTNAHGIGVYNIAGSGNFDGYMTEVNFIDGQALTPSSFGETDTDTGSWKHKPYSGTYGTNGFYLKFADASAATAATIGKDSSGNSNNWTPNNISVTAGTTYDAMTDSPTLTSPTVANYCTLNPLPYYGGYNVLSRGNLQFTSGNSNWMRALATFAVSSGKWYWEVTANHTQSQMHGITHATQLTYSAGATNWVGYDATGYAYFSDGGTKYNGNSGVSYGAGYGAGDIIGVAFDADNGKLYFSKNGVFQASGDPAAGTNAAFTGLTSGPYVPAVSVSTFAGANTCDANFGQRPFAYTPPTGFVRLNTYNLPDSTIKKGNTVMDATIYTGNGASNRTITNSGSFKPDLVWVKGRNTASWNHFLNDSVRGFTNYLISSSTGAEGTTSPSIVSSAASNGFVIQANGNSNNNGDTYVGWQWQAGQGTNTTNTSGTITSTVSVNANAGFSVVTWTGNGGASTIGHGLGIAPKFIIVRTRNYANNWFCYHGSLANTEVMYLDTTGAKDTSRTDWNSTSPTSSVFSVNGGNTNRSSINMLAYCWAEIAGFSKFGSYTGNGSTDGPFVYTGFRPKFVMIKCSSAGSTDWFMLDTSRDTYNAEANMLFPNLSNAETNVGAILDGLSNGFKLKIAGGAATNTNGSTYIYMAFAENPFKNANAR